MIAIVEMAAVASVRSRTSAAAQNAVANSVEIVATKPNQVIQKAFESFPPCGPSLVGTCGSLERSRRKKRR